MKCIFHHQKISSRGISSNTLNLLLTMGRESHPREFAALLGSEEGVIREVDIIPGTIGGSQSASVLFDMIPINLGYVGSAHSHPSGVIRPSEADIGFFSRAGSYHIIVGYPYEHENWGCFHSDGSRIELPVISDD
ncbi:MAG: Mov34/MPN/PAD-1 family protein [Methanobacteriota archaeon]